VCGWRSIPKGARARAPAEDHIRRVIQRSEENLDLDKTYEDLDYKTSVLR